MEDICGSPSSAEESSSLEASGDADAVNEDGSAVDDEEEEGSSQQVAAEETSLLPMEPTLCDHPQLDTEGFVVCRTRVSHKTGDAIATFSKCVPKDRAHPNDTCGCCVDDDGNCLPY